MSLFLLRTPRTFRCSSWTSTTRGGLLCSSPTPNTHPLLLRGVSFRSSCTQVCRCISFSFLRVFFSSPHPLFCRFLSFGVLLLFFNSSIISFMASVVVFTRVSICRVWASVRFAMISSVISACSWIAFALKCFADSLFCLFSFGYSAVINVLMLAHVLSAVGFASHSRRRGDLWCRQSRVLLPVRVSVRSFALVLHLNNPMCRVRFRLGTRCRLPRE